MKKNQEEKEIRERALELAKTGRYSRYLPIERDLVDQGYKRTRRVLDDDHLRKQIKEICDIAQSPEEIENRKNFSDWLESFIKKSKEKLEKEFPKIKLYINADYFFLSLNNKRIKFIKELGGKHLVRIRENRIDNIIYSNGPEILDKTFDEITFDDLISYSKSCLN